MRNFFLLILFWVMVGPMAWAESDDMQAIGGFAMDRREVSIAQFARYAPTTGIVTSAEKSGGGSTYEVGWVQRKGWTWRTPYGLPANDREPVVHITLDLTRFHGRCELL